MDGHDRARLRTSALRCAAAAVTTAALLIGCAGGLPRSVAADAQPRPPAPLQPPVQVALVLSGGGLRGMAHLGVIRVLQAHGLRPDLVVGTSVGAIVGGAYASGLSAEALARMALPAELDPWGNWLVAPEQRSAALEAFVAGMVGGRRIEDFPLRFVAVSTARRSGCVVLFGAGDAARAIVASSALPGALAPVHIGAGDFVDGSLGAPLPVRIARALGARRVIAVDTTFHAEPVVPDGLVDSVLHAGMVMASNLALADRAAADIVLTPVLPPVPEVTLANRERLVAAGEIAALAQIDRLRALFARDADGPRPAQTADAVTLCGARLPG